MDRHRTDTTQTGGRARRKRITAQVVTALKPFVKGNRFVWDNDLTGFGARITPAGAVSFVLRFVLDGRERVYTIGKHPDLTSGAARDLATTLRGKIVTGEDPMEARR